MGNTKSIVYRAREVSVRREGKKVLVLESGRLAIQGSYEDMAMLARAIIAKCKEAEEEDKAPEIIFDEALLIRKGIPISLSNHPKIREEAKKEAAHNTRLRRYLPGGIRSHFHTRPISVVQLPPPKKKEGSDD